MTDATATLDTAATMGTPSTVYAPTTALDPHLARLKFANENSKVYIGSFGDLPDHNDKKTPAPMFSRVPPPFLSATEVVRYAKCYEVLLDGLNPSQKQYQHARSHRDKASRARKELWDLWFTSRNRVRIGGYAEPEFSSNATERLFFVAPDYALQHEAERLQMLIDDEGEEQDEDEDDTMGLDDRQATKDVKAANILVAMSKKHVRFSDEVQQASYEGGEATIMADDEEMTDLEGELGGEEIDEEEGGEGYSDDKPEVEEEGLRINGFTAINRLPVDSKWASLGH